MPSHISKQQNKTTIEWNFHGLEGWGLIGDVKIVTMDGGFWYDLQRKQQYHAKHLVMRKGSGNNKGGAWMWSCDLWPIDKTSIGKSDVEVCEPICLTTAVGFFWKFYRSNDFVRQKLEILLWNLALLEREILNILWWH